MVKIPFGDLKRQYHGIKREIDTAVSSALESGWYVLGKNGEEFERSFAAYCGAKFAVGVGSGTEAIHLGLLAAGVKPGDEVITVANTCVPTLSAITFAGAKPVLVDIDENTYTMSPEALKKAVSRKTRAIVPVHLYGQTADMGAIMGIARERGIKVIEDCAQAHGAEFMDKKAGAFGDCGAYSFYPSKNLGCNGDGGAVVTSDVAIYERMLMLRNYGQEKRYYHSIKGYNSRLDEVQAAILIAKLRHLDRWNGRRREIAAFYGEKLKGLPVVLPKEAAGRKHVYHLYVVQVGDRDIFQNRMAEAGVQTVIHYPVPIHRQKSYYELKKFEPKLKATDRVAGRIVSLPNFPELTDGELDHIVKSVEASL